MIERCNRVGFIIIPAPYDGGAEPICDICDAQYVWNADNLLIHPSSPIDTSLPRPDWADYFFAIAVEVSQRASCPRAKCGTVLVNPITHQILSTGYNGSPPGEPHCIDEGCIMEDDHCQRAIHSEVNAVAHAARSGISVDGAIAYVVSTKHTESCRECKKVLKSANIACTIVRKII